MRMKFASLLLVAFTTSSFAEVHEIHQMGISFVPDTVTANPGDTIRWIHSAGTHTVNHGDSCVLADNPLFSLTLSAASPIVEWVIPSAINGSIPFFCNFGTHCAAFGMSGEIIVVPSPGSAVHEVQQVGATFVPDTIQVAPGDTVRWTWSNGGHTVSSGEHALCTEDNIHFNMPLDDLHTTVLWEVPETMPDSIEYLCVFHCELGHIGTIERSILGDLNGDGCVDGADLAIVLGCWGGACGDLNGDGNSDGADLATVLGAWGCG